MTQVSVQERTAASIRQRLLDRARARDENYQLLLDGYAVERLIYRLSISPVSDRFVLKGAMLFALWFDQPHRPTRDADFLGMGALDAAQLAEIMHELCTTNLEDGVQYDQGSVTVEPIRKEANYNGFRISLQALIGKARCSVELGVSWLYRHDDRLRLPYQDHLSALIHEPTFVRAYAWTCSLKTRGA